MHIVNAIPLIILKPGTYRNQLKPLTPFTGFSTPVFMTDSVPSFANFCVGS